MFSYAVLVDSVVVAHRLIALAISSASFVTANESGGRESEGSRPTTTTAPVRLKAEGLVPEHVRK